MASGAWYGAYRHMVRVTEPVELWLVKTLPFTPRSPRLLDEWIALDYDITVCDPGKQEVMDRLRARGMDVGKRLQAGVLQWYRQGITQTASMRGSRLAGQGSRPSGSPTDPMRPDRLATGAAGMVTVVFLRSEAKEHPAPTVFGSPQNNKKSPKIGTAPQNQAMKMLQTGIYTITVIGAISHDRFRGLGERGTDRRTAGKGHTGVHQGVPGRQGREPDGRLHLFIDAEHRPQHRRAERARPRDKPQHDQSSGYIQQLEGMYDTMDDDPEITELLGKAAR